MVHTPERPGITIDDLALMIGRQFHDIGTQFTELRREIGAFESKMNARFDRLENKFDLLEMKVMRDHEPRIQKIEEHLEIA